MLFGRSVVSRVLLELLYLALGIEAGGLASEDVYARGRWQSDGAGSWKAGCSTAHGGKFA